MNDQAADTALSLLTILLYAAGGFVLGALLSVIISVIMRFATARHPHLIHVSKRLKHRQRLVLLTLGIAFGVAIATGTPVAAKEPTWRPSYIHGLWILLIVATGYLISGLISAIEDSVLARFEGLEGTPQSRRVRTQMQVITRVGIAVIWVCVVAGVLLTFTWFRAVGASLFASAGLLSIIAGLAAQSSLANLFAGMQIAFSDALRVGDVVIAEQQWGHIEEITLTYVVVRTWDDRRLLLPSTYFTTKPFENWTKKTPDLLGAVEFDLDWMVPVEAMRLELERIVLATDLWDGRIAKLQATESTEGRIRVRAVVSAENSGLLWDLRCLVREKLLTWLQIEAPYALPRMRLEPDTTTAPDRSTRIELVEQTRRQLEEERAEADSQDAQETMALPAHRPEPETVEPRAVSELPRIFRGLGRLRRGSPEEEDTEGHITHGGLFSGSAEGEERQRRMAGRPGGETDPGLTVDQDALRTQSLPTQGDPQRRPDERE